MQMNNQKNDLLRSNRTFAQNEENIDLMKTRPGRLIQPPSGASRTDQDAEAESNPNKIIERYNITGELHHVRTTRPVYLDMTAIDFQEMREKTTRIEETFMELPGKIRKKFEHNPAKMMFWLQDPKNFNEAVELGLVELSEPKEEPRKVRTKKQAEKDAQAAKQESDKK